MHSDSFHAMGTTVTVTAEHAPSFTSVRDLFDHVEQVCSRFLDDSELAEVNRSQDEAVTLSPLLTDVFDEASNIRALTHGLIDPAIGGLMKAWGYDRTFEDVVDLDQAPILPVDDSEWWLEGCTLHRTPGLEFDLGGIAKGWTADLAVQLDLAPIVNAGGDLRSVREATVVDIDDPSGGIAASLHVGVGALATSSVAKRSWTVAGRRVHHIIDPRTGTPATTPILSASVIADRAVLAEAGAKTVLLLGSEGLAWADQQEWIRAALCVWNDGSIYATAGVTVA
jgi:FAD:protein FMN transferase